MGSDRSGSPCSWIGSDQIWKRSVLFSPNYYLINNKKLEEFTIDVVMRSGLMLKEMDKNDFEEAYALLVGL